jgi:hypothetical protein
LRIKAAKFFAPLLEIRKPPVFEYKCIIRFYSDGLVIILDGELVLSESTVSASPVVVGMSIIRFQTDGFIIIIDGELVLFSSDVKPSPLVIGIGVVGLQTDYFIIMINSLCDFSFFIQ